VSSLFRPHTQIDDGLITSYEEPANRFYCCEEANLVLFQGKEPNLHWGEFAECLFSLGAEFGVTMFHFVGSVAGAVPHTKAPRFFGAVSEELLVPTLQEHGLHPSNYEGPASFVTYLMTCAQNRGVPMTTLVTEIPAYLQGRNTKCIEAATRKLAAILDLPISFDELESMSGEFEARLDEAVRERPELAELVRKMEEDYDQEAQEAQETEMPGLKDWFEKQDIRLD
jgi:proteasome assembly chaperone (PAC2) family protein